MITSKNVYQGLHFPTACGKVQDFVRMQPKQHINLLAMPSALPLAIPAALYTSTTQKMI